MSPESWQKPNTEAQKPAPEREVESVESLERKLSPEQIEQIMAKVEDINAPGNAFSVITVNYGQDLSLPASLSKLENVLSDGLLGYSYFWPEQEKRKSTVDKDMWAKNTRAHKNALINFNITGRMLQEKDYKFPVANSTWMKGNDHDNIAVLFDFSKYEEDAPIPAATENKLKNRTFRIHDNYAGENQADSMYGFTLSHRVPPRFFKGLVIKLVTGEKHKNEYGDLRGVECRDPARYNEQANKIGKIMQEIYRDRKDFLLPIYSHSGSLYWPKQMTYKEVKEFVAERDTKKEDAVK